MPVVTTIKIQEKKQQSLTDHRYRNWWQYASELVFLLVLSVILLEAFFNICGIGQQEFLQPDPILGSRHIPNKLVVWRLEGFSCDRFSSAGLRDVEHNIEKAPHTIRIALLGDSSTEGLQVPLECTYGRVLEKLLNDQQKMPERSQPQPEPKRTNAAGSVIKNPEKFEVINFACAGYSTGQQLIQYRMEVAKYKPDIVLVLYNRGDAVENVLDQAVRATAQPRPYFYLDQYGKLQEDGSILRLNYLKLTPNPVIDFLRMHSRLYGVFSQTHLALSINEPRYHKIMTWFAKLLMRMDDKGNLAAEPVLYPQQGPLKITTALVDALRVEAASSGAQFVLVAFPNTIHETEYAQQLSALAQLGYAKHFPFIDLTQSFITHPEPKSLFVQYHFSSAGHETVAKQLCAIVHNRQ